MLHTGNNSAGSDSMDYLQLAKFFKGTWVGTRVRELLVPGKVSKFCLCIDMYHLKHRSSLPGKASASPHITILLFR